MYIRIWCLDWISKNKQYIYVVGEWVGLLTSRHISYTVRSRDGWRGVFLFLLKLFSTLIPTKRLLSLSLPHPQYLAIITSEITPLMEQNYPSGPCPENIQFSQRAWILFEAESNIWKVGKWMKLKVLRETLTRSCRGLTIKIINIKSLKRVGIWDNCMHQKLLQEKDAKFPGLHPLQVHPMWCACKRGKGIPFLDSNKIFSSQYHNIDVDILTISIKCRSTHCSWCQTT